MTACKFRKDFDSMGQGKSLHCVWVKTVYKIKLSLYDNISTHSSVFTSKSYTTSDSHTYFETEFFTPFKLLKSESVKKDMICQWLSLIHI